MEKDTKLETPSAVVPVSESASDILENQGRELLKQESAQLLSQVLAEQDSDKIKDLTQLFNVNQNKKNMMRNNKLNELIDLVIKQTYERFSTHPEEFSNKELLDSLKTIQESIEKNQKQINSEDYLEAPIIQINQQTNKLSIGEEIQDFDRASKEKVKLAVLNFLQGLGTKAQIVENAEITEDTDKPE